MIQCQEKDMPGAEQDLKMEAEGQRTTPRSRQRSWCFASILLISTVACGVLEAQLLAVGFGLWKNATLVEDLNGTLVNTTRSTAKLAFRAPYLYTLCRFLGRAFTLPTAFFLAWLYSVITASQFSAKQFFRKSAEVASSDSDGVTICGVLAKVSIPTVFQMGVALGFVVALAYISPSIVQACLSGTVALSYVLSIVFLQLPYSIIKTIFVLCAFSGIAMVTYATTRTPLSSTAYIGLISVLIGAASISFFQLSYKRAFPQLAGPSQAAFTTSVTFSIAALVFWPVPLALRLAGVEVWEFRDIPWGYLITGVTAAVSTTFFNTYGLAVSDPFFISLAEILKLVTNGLVDHFVRGVSLGFLQIAGIIVIGISFIVLILPDEYLKLATIRSTVKTIFSTSIRFVGSTSGLGRKGHVEDGANVLQK